MSRSGIIQPDVYSYKDPDAIMPYGEALLTDGLAVRDAINGLGLVTRGLLWQIFDIWIDSQYYDNLTTSWAAASGSSITTTWNAAAGSSVSTAWTDVQYGIWGEYTPET